MTCHYFSNLPSKKPLSPPATLSTSLIKHMAERNIFSLTFRGIRLLQIENIFHDQTTCKIWGLWKEKLQITMLLDFSIIIYNILTFFSSIILEKDVQIQWILLNLGPINHILDFIFWIQSDTITNFNPI